MFAILPFWLFELPDFFDCFWKCKLLSTCSWNEPPPLWELRAISFYATYVITLSKEAPHKKQLESYGSRWERKSGYGVLTELLTTLQLEPALVLRTRQYTSSDRLSENRLGPRITRWIGEILYCYTSYWGFSVFATWKAVKDGLPYKHGTISNKNVNCTSEA